MSFEIMRRVIATEVHDENDYPMPVAKALLLYMAHHAHDDGTGVFLKGETLAEETGYSRHTIITQLKHLVERGWIVDTFRRPGRTTHYAIVLERLAIVPKQLRADSPTLSSANELGRVQQMNSRSAGDEHHNISPTRSRSAEVDTPLPVESLQSKETYASTASLPDVAVDIDALEVDPLDLPPASTGSSRTPIPHVATPDPHTRPHDHPGRVHEERTAYSA